MLAILHAVWLGLGLGLDLVSCLVSGYAHVFILLSVVIITLPSSTCVLVYRRTGVVGSTVLFSRCESQLSQLRAVCDICDLEMHPLATISH